MIQKRRAFGVIYPVCESRRFKCIVYDLPRRWSKLLENLRHRCPLLQSFGAPSPVRENTVREAKNYVLTVE
jgi:hypothetical protein